MFGSAIALGTGLGVGLMCGGPLAWFSQPAPLAFREPGAIRHDITADGLNVTAQPVLYEAWVRTRVSVTTADGEAIHLEVPWDAVPRVREGVVELPAASVTLRVVPHR